VPFDWGLRDPRPTGPDLGVDPADEGDEQEDHPRAGERLAGKVTARRAEEQPAGIEAQAGEQQDERKLNELRMEISQELPESHRAGCAPPDDIHGS
jgi:hypothetical protein